MWILFLVVVNTFDPYDIPGKIQLHFKDKSSCEYALESMTSYVKFSWFRVEGQCFFIKEKQK